MKKKGISKVISTQREIDTIPEKQVTDIFCKYCHRNFSTKSIKIRHERFVCSQNPSPELPETFECGTCKNSFKYKWSRTQHMLKCGIESSKPFECGICEKNFKYKFNLNRHMRNRHMLKCGIESSNVNNTKSNKVQQSSISHLSSGPYQSKCTYCPKMILKCAKRFQPDNNNAMCTHCNKVFNRLENENTGFSSEGTKTRSKSLEIDRILGVADNKGELLFQIKWKNSSKVQLLPSWLANSRFTHKVVEYYEERIKWHAMPFLKIHGENIWIGDNLES